MTKNTTKNTMRSPWPTYKTKNRVRLVTAASLFDGHDAAINIMRRLLQDGGAEVIHLGHNRSVSEIVKACVEEHVQGVCISSYQGGHNEFFQYLVDCLKHEGAGHVKIFGGGGGTILLEEIAQLQTYGVTRIYSPADGQALGLSGIMDDVLRECDFDILNTIDAHPVATAAITSATAAYLSIAEAAEKASDSLCEKLSTFLKNDQHTNPPLVIGITGTGGAGKSSLMDELILRFRNCFPDHKVAVLCVDPSKRKTTGSLLGDRIRMNALDEGVFLRSLSTRESKTELSPAIKPCLDVLRASDFDLVFLESAGIGQGGAAITEFADISIYAMTAEYGASSQLEKIEMLDCADFIVINKYDRTGAEDALRDVRKQVRRNRRMLPETTGENLMVFGTVASRFHDAGVDGLFENLADCLNAKDAAREWTAASPPSSVRCSQNRAPHIPAVRTHYLAEIAKTMSDFHARGHDLLKTVTKLYSINQTLAMLNIEVPQGPHTPLALVDSDTATVKEMKQLYKQTFDQLDDQAKELFLNMHAHLGVFEKEIYSYQVRDHTIQQDLVTETLSGLRVPKLALPVQKDWATLFRYIYFENVPGFFPYTCGVFPLRRQGEDPTRMFAGEGAPAKTNKRFHLLAKGQAANRLSTAFDSVTLYGQDPAEQLDIFGKVGESGVSICSVEDVERLYAGFDLCDPGTSVSMTINGPAPIMLAYFMLTATRQCCRRFLVDQGKLTIPEEAIYQPETGNKTWQDTRNLLSDDEYATCMEKALQSVRGTVQADILKEDQAQNTCIFSLDFALRMMGDTQAYFIDHNVRKYYSVSISGYHIAEAGANPIMQLAFTLANGFSYVEAYLARGMAIDDFAPNLSFFFSNGLDPEYAVLGRVARRIWAVAMKHLYHADERSQRLKYHVQTSGRSLHAQDITFNDIRTTLQALAAYQDNCNSLHTNASDEAVTTPTPETVRTAVAIQMIVAKEFGQTKNENPLQGSYFMEWLTQEVEKAVLEEFQNLSTRGGVMGAMETQYQRARIQEESLVYESKKNSGELPIIGVNTFVSSDKASTDEKEIAPVRCPKEEKTQRVAACEAFKKQHQDQAPQAARAILDCAVNNSNLFEALMQHAEMLTLGQLSQTLYQAGGKYRRGM